MKKIKILLFSIFFLFYGNCFAQKTLSSITQQYQIASPNERKISSLVLNITAEMKHLGLNTENIESTDYSERHTNFLFQVDRKGRLRVTISYIENSEPIINVIEKAGGEIESSNKKIKQIVAWIPYQNLTTIAEE